MLEGLEISVINLSEVLIENEIFRFDSEFQLKEYINSIDKIKQKENSPFNNKLELLTDGKHGGVTLTDDGVVFLRTTNIQENRIDLTDLRFISKKESEETLRAEFESGDLLLTTIGTIGLCAKVPENFPRATINQNLVRIVLKDKSESSLLCCFLNSKYGRNQLLRYGAGNVYQMINYPNLRKVLIPKLDNIKEKINHLYLYSEKLSKDSKSCYTKAEKLLIKEIGLKDFVPNDEAVNIKSFSESFATSGRLDAEYYQLKFDSYENQIRKSVKDVVLVNSVLSDSIKNGSTPKQVFRENGEINFIRVEAFKNDLDFDDNDCFSVSEETYENYTHNRVVKNDILVSMTGTIGNVSIYNSESKGLINQNLVKLTANTDLVLVNYLALYIKTVGSIFLTKLQTGNVQPYVNIPNFSNLIVPIIKRTKQKQIADLIEESFALKKHSEQLLNVAKKAVEIAIEENEKIALKYINDQTNAYAS